MEPRPGGVRDAPSAASFADFRARASRVARRADAPRLVVSPYRFNPLGAHVDHQGGEVLARTLDQYTLLAFWASAAPRVALRFDGAVGARDATAAGDDARRAARCAFAVGEPADDVETREWDGADDDRRPRYAYAAARVLDAHAVAEGHGPLRHGLDGVVHGTLVSAGLSSSASVVLAYLVALARVNSLALDGRTLVELVRRVENEHLGLANGVQDQMSIVFGHPRSLSRLDVDEVEATRLDDPPTADAVRWLVVYSGVSRELAAGSGFNTRVAECREAAALLHPGAGRLGDVPPARRGESDLAALPGPLGRRARHVFTEIDRVRVGSDAWRHGDWRFFGELMNASCRSSIEQYESGSEWLIALHGIAREVPGVLGSRFSGGGYGGCLVALVERDAADAAGETLLGRYLERYPDKRGKARAFVATPERGVRIE